MKYIYVQPSEDRLASICKQRNEDILNCDGFDEYIVDDNFDLDLVIQDSESGEDVRLPGAITFTEFLSRYNGDYASKRVASYPKISDQLDMLWHAMDSNEENRLEPFYSTIKAIKDSNPKP